MIFVGVLEKVTDEFNVVSWQPQMEGSKAGRELPSIVDQLISLHMFSRDADRGYVLDQGRDAYTGTGHDLLNDPKVIELYLGTLAKIGS